VTRNDDLVENCASDHKFFHLVLSDNNYIVYLFPAGQCTAYLLSSLKRE
jgi:hypothetical protein